MIFLILVLISDTLLSFENPRVVDVRDTLKREGMPEDSNQLDFTGSKGFFVSINGFSLSFSQALDIAIFGKLSKDFGVKARLRDSDVSYGSDYYSKSLSDVDEVYLMVNGPDSLMVNIGKIFANWQRIIGFGFAYMGVSGAYGTTEQKSIRKELKIEPLYTGPYFVDYGYEIVPGSLRLFVNGIEVGKESYFFDYSSGALYFMQLYVPNPYDIVYVEYASYSVMPALYSYAAYSGGSAKVSFERYTVQKGPYTGLPPGLYDLLVEGGDIGSSTLNGGFESADGDYIKQDSIYIFVGEGLGNHKVYFKYVGYGQGSYIFDNLIGGYRFVGNGNGFYEPQIEVEPPYDILVTGVDYSGNFDVSGELSYKDQNTLSSLDDDDNLGVNLELAKKFKFETAHLDLLAKYRSDKFSQIEKGVDPDWGTEIDAGYSQMDAIFTLDDDPTSLKVSLRNIGQRKSYFAKLLTSFGPFYGEGKVQKGDSLSYSGILGWKSEVLPDGNILYLKSDRPIRFLIHDRFRDLEYLFGFTWTSEERKILPVAEADVRTHSEGSDLNGRISYLPEYWNQILYDVGVSFELLKGITLRGSASFKPTYKSLKEERYYHTESGNYSYDASTGLFVPFSNGGFERDVFYLGVVDTALQSTYTMGFDLDLFFHGSFTNFNTVSKSEEINGLELQIARGAFQFFAIRRDYTDRLYINTQTKKESRYVLFFPVYKQLSSSLSYEQYFEYSFEYSIRKASLLVGKKFLHVESGVSSTHYKGVDVPGLFFDLLGDLGNDKIKFFVKAFICYPFSEAERLPILVPTSKRYGVNLNLRKKANQGEFFVELFLQEGIVAVRKARAGYNFLF